jgi:hypothetical protein
VDDHPVDVRVGPAQELSREVADGTAGPVVGMRLAGVDEEPGAVVGADAARVGRDDVEVVVGEAAAEDAGGRVEPTTGKGARRRSYQLRERPREQAPHQATLVADHVAPRSAHEGHAAAVDAAGDAAQDQALGVHVEVRQGLGRRRGHGVVGLGGSRDPSGLAGCCCPAGWWRKKTGGGELGGGFESPFIPEKITYLILI